MISHPTQRTIWQYATGELAVGRRSKIREHAASCATCKSELHRAIAATRALSGKSGGVPTAGQLETWGEEVLTRRTTVEPSPLRRYVIPLVGATMVTAALLALPREQSFEDELVSRGSQATPQVNLRVLCVSAETSVEIEEATNGCAIGSFLKILVGNNASARQRMAVFQAANSAVYPLYPAGFGEPLLRLPESTEPMPGSKAVQKINADVLRIVAFALNDDAIDATDPLLSWAQTIEPGHYQNVLGRADAVVVAINVMGEKP